MIFSIFMILKILDYIEFFIFKRVNVFLSRVGMERHTPFKITADAEPFYSESNIRHLERIIVDIEAGKAHFMEHELIED